MEMFVPAVILWEVLTCELEGMGGGTRDTKILFCSSNKYPLCKLFFVLELARNWDTRRQTKVCSFVRAIAPPVVLKYVLTDVLWSK